MGWFLVQAKGPRNTAIELDQFAQIHDVFANAGVPPSSMIEPIKNIVVTQPWSRHHQVPDDDNIFDDIVLY